MTIDSISLIGPLGKYRLSCHTAVDLNRILENVPFHATNLTTHDRNVFRYEVIPSWNRLYNHFHGNVQKRTDVALVLHEYLCERNVQV